MEIVYVMKVIMIMVMMNNVKLVINYALNVLDQQITIVQNVKQYQMSSKLEIFVNVFKGIFTILAHYYVNNVLLFVMIALVIRQINALVVKLLNTDQ